MQLYRLRQEVRDDQIPIVNSPFCLPHRRKRRSILEMERLETQLWRYRWEAMGPQGGISNPKLVEDTTKQSGKICQLETIRQRREEGVF